ncbi:hypothetical protein PoB_002281400 [Plakobranchus ocellatus]|uniref:Mutator-like transposase domain-containing protein n=1 Tax=Plakobranchus ocellatus TaxID=259542 RepID=A0AAV3ZR20_9GAST|nr:hypothetical protein PoB_002281400 [Plakobranchus ocellatus]
MGKKGKGSRVIQLSATRKRRWAESEDVEQRESTEHVAGPSTSEFFHLDIPLSERPEQPQEEPIPMSRTEKKLELSASSSVIEADMPEGNGRTVADFSFINNLVPGLCCSAFSLQTLQSRINRKKSKDFSLLVEIYYSTCKTVVSQSFSSARETSGRGPRAHSINKSVTQAAVMAGMGSDAFNLFCEYMDLPGLHKKTFLKYAQGFYTKFEEIKKQIFSRAVSIAQAEHARKKGIELMEETVLDTCVSYDDMWMKRDRIGCVIDVVTALSLMQGCCQLIAICVRQQAHG